MFSKTVRIFLILSFITFLIIPSVILAAETLDFKSPKGWSKDDKARERWLGPDPTIRIEKGDNLIRLTHYGLEGSREMTPEIYISRLKKVFTDFNWIDTIDSITQAKVAGKAATSVKVHSNEKGNRSYDEGEYIPARYTYEEFLVVPVDKGFWVLNLTFRQSARFGSVEFSPEEIKEKEKDLKEVLKTWQEFLTTCRFLKT